MRVKLHPEARIDLREGKAFYRQRSPLAAIAFAHQIDAAITRIEAPLRYPVGAHGTSEYVLPSSFPYTVVYRVQQNVVVIVAVAHQSRDQGTGSIDRDAVQ
jgi:plasmid stabilization system protein ParE